MALLMVCGSTWAANAQNRHSCTIIVKSPGELKASFDTTEISTKGFGGRSAVVVVRATNSRYRVHLDPPTGFSASPSGGMTDTVFSSSYSANGATNFFNKPASYPTKLKRGRSRLKVDLTAKKLTGSFPAGDYRASTTIRCE